jgi:hypothetical protein
MTHISVHVEPTQLGGHTHVRVFAGNDALHRGKCGDLVFTNEEWALFGRWLEYVASETSGEVELVVDAVILG